MTAWLAASLSRARQMPTLTKILGSFERPRKMTKDEIAREKARHERLVKELAPDAVATEEQLMAFTERQLKEAEKRFRR